MLRYRIVIFSLALSLFYLELANAHITNNIAYVAAEVQDNKVLFPNLDNEGVSSHLFLAGYDETRSLIIDTIKVSNNGKECELRDFLTHQEDSLSREPYYFIAYCENTISKLTIRDHLELENISAKVYNLIYKDQAETFTANVNIDISVELLNNKIVVKDKNLDSTPDNNDPRLSENNSQGTTKSKSQIKNLGDSNLSDTSTPKTKGDDNYNSKATSNSETLQKRKSGLFPRYLYFGISHILSGLDHIFFILAYILLASSLMALLKGITGFTISHSATLSLAALSIITLPSSVVEPIIAFSIVTVGVLAYFNLAIKWLGRFGIIFLFGLFHGLGFAGSIAEVGFPRDGFITALLGFNIGIELGQLLIVFAIYPLLELLSKKNQKLYHTTIKISSLIIVVTGTFWFIQRIFYT